MLAGLEWVAQNAEPPAVVSLSLGLSAGTGAADQLEEATRRLVNDFNVTVVAAAGQQS